MKKNILTLLFVAVIVLQGFSQAATSNEVLTFPKELIDMSLIDRGIIFLKSGVSFRARNIDFKEKEITFSLLDGIQKSADIEMVSMVDRRKYGVGAGMAIFGGLGLATSAGSEDIRVIFLNTLSGALSGIIVGALIQWDTTIYLSPNASLKKALPQHLRINTPDASTKF